MIRTLISITVGCQRLEAHAFHQRKTAGFRQRCFFPFPRQLKNTLHQHRVTSDRNLEGTGVVLGKKQLLLVEGFGWKRSERCSGERGLWKELVGSVCWHRAW